MSVFMPTPPLACSIPFSLTLTPVLTPVVIVLVTLLLPSSSLADQNAALFHQNSEDCGCYVTDGVSSSYYLYHRFFDFRSIPDSSSYDIEPPNVTSPGGDEPSQRGYLDSDHFTDDWGIATWGHNRSADDPIHQQNSPQNVYIQRDSDSDSDDDDNDSTYLVFRAHRTRDFSSTAEIESLIRNVFYASIRLRARVRGSTGAVAGLFTYMNDSCESDIEILTRDPSNRIRYTNQPTEGPDGYDVPAASTNAVLPDGILWTDWVTHRIDWMGGVSSWYVNDIFVSNKTYGIPRFPSYLVINMWSNGGSWSETMPIGSSAYLDIQWIQMAFNTSGAEEGYPDPMNELRPSGTETAPPTSGPTTTDSGTDPDDRCGTVCAVDGVKRVGWPEVRSRSTTSLGCRVEPLFFSRWTWWVRDLLFILAIWFGWDIPFL